MVERISNLVSVIIPAFNRGEYIIECLDSIKKQTYKNIEIIVIDDASTDNTAHLVKYWMKNNRNDLIASNTVFISLPRNVGFAGALNVGYYLSKGEFIAVQDSDDLSHPERIQKQVSYLNQNPHLSLVGTNFAAFRDGNFKNSWKAVWLRFGEDEIKKRYENKQHCVCHGTLLFRGEVFDKYGGPTRNLDGAEDYEFIYKCFQEGIDNINEVLYYYRVHKKNRSNEFYDDK